MSHEIDSLIVYVHGAFASKRSWNFIQKQVNRSIRNKATHAEIFFEYDLQEQDAFVILVNLVESIRSSIKIKKPRKVILVGHSFGGVLCVAASRELDHDRELNIDSAAITMSAPFNGAKIASIVTMFTPSSTFFMNISHNSQFMWNFKHKKLTCPTHSFVTTQGRVKWIAGENDGVVTLESQLHFKLDPLNTIDVIDVNHFEILLSDNVAARIVSEVIPIKVAA